MSPMFRTAFLAGLSISVAAYAVTILRQRLARTTVQPERRAARRVRR